MNPFSLLVTMLALFTMQVGSVSFAQPEGEPSSDAQILATFLAQEEADIAADKAAYAELKLALSSACRTITLSKRVRNGGFINFGIGANVLGAGSIIYEPGVKNMGRLLVRIGGVLLVLAAVAIGIGGYEIQVTKSEALNLLRKLDVVQNNINIREQTIKGLRAQQQEE